MSPLFSTIHIIYRKPIVAVLFSVFYLTKIHLFIVLFNSDKILNFGAVNVSFIIMIYGNKFVGKLLV